MRSQLAQDRLPRPARPGLRPRRDQLDPGHHRRRGAHRRGPHGIGETDLNAWVARACIEAPGTHTMDRGLGERWSGWTRPTRGAAGSELYVGYGDDRPARRGHPRARRARHGALGHRAARRAGVPRGSCSASRAAPTPDAVRVADAGGRRRLGRLRRAMVDQALARARPAASAPRSSRSSSTGRTPTSGLRRQRRAARRGHRRRARGGRRRTSRSWSTSATRGRLRRPRARRASRPGRRTTCSSSRRRSGRDDLDGYAELARRSPMPIAAGEWLATRHEFAECSSRGGAGRRCSPTSAGSAA